MPHHGLSFNLLMRFVLCMCVLQAIVGDASPGMYAILM